MDLNAGSIHFGRLIRIDFVGDGQINVVFEVAGRLMSRRAFVDLRSTEYTFGLSCFWNPAAAIDISGPRVEEVAS